MYDSKKAFISWKDACATSQSIALEETYSVVSRFSSPSMRQRRGKAHLDMYAQRVSQ